MAIELVHEKWHDKGKPDCVAPLIRGDYCGEYIEDASTALAIWPRHDGYVYGPVGPHYHVHSGTCDRALSKRLGTRTYWQPLQAYLYYLTNIAGWDPDRSKDSARIMAGVAADES